MEMAELAAKRTTCTRRGVGAIAVVKDRVVATGYNGPPAGMPHCTSDTCIRNLRDITSGTQLEVCRAVHAEANLVVHAATSGTDLTNATIYCTHTPCASCVKLLLGTRMHKLVCNLWYPDSYTLELLQLANFYQWENWVPKTCHDKYAHFREPGEEKYIVFYKLPLI